MALPGSNLNLSDIPAFSSLANIANDMNIDLALFGGAASRAVMWYGEHGTDIDISLFELVPYSSDFDLRHLGGREESAVLRKRIDSEVPFAGWFRWSIVDAEMWRKAEKARRSSTTVPIRQIEIGNRSLTHVPLQALQDIRNKCVSYRRNPSFEESYLAQEGRDLEFFGGLLVLAALCDMRQILGHGQILSSDNLEALFTWSRLKHGFSLIETNPVMRSRLWNLVNSLLVRGGSRIFDEFTFVHRLVEAATEASQMREPLSRLISGEYSCATSRATSNGEFRVPELNPEILTGSNALAFARTFLKNLSNKFRPSADAPLAIDPNLELIAAVPQVSVKPGNASQSHSIGGDPYYSIASDEFLEISWPADPSQILNPNGITACAIPHPETGIPYVVDVLAVGGVLSGSRPWVRLRLDDLIQHGPDARNLKITILVLQSRAEEIAGN